MTERGDCTVPTDARDALAEAMCGQTFIADWYEKADLVLVDLADRGWQLVPTDSKREGPSWPT